MIFTQLYKIWILVKINNKKKKTALARAGSCLDSVLGLAPTGELRPAAAAAAAAAAQRSRITPGRNTLCRRGIVAPAWKHSPPSPSFPRSYCVSFSPAEEEVAQLTSFHQF